MNEINKRIEKVKLEIKAYHFSLLQKTLLVVLFCFTTFVVTAYIGYLLKNNYFKLDMDKQPINPTLDFIVSMILFLINMLFIFGFSLHIYSPKLFIILLGFAPLYMLSGLYSNNALITSTVVPILFSFIAAVSMKYTMKNSFKALVRCLFLYLIMFVYQYVAMQIKLDYIGFEHLSALPLQAKIIFQIDFSILLFIIYILGGGERFEKKKKLAMECTICTYEKNVNSVSEEDSEIEEELQAMPRSYRRKILFAITAIQIFQFIFILAIGMIGNIWLEMLIIIVTFWVARYFVFKKSWHSDSVFICTVASAAIFYLASKASIPLEISMIIPVLIGVLVAYALYLTAIHLDEMQAYKTFYYNHNEFNPDTATKEILVERCRLSGFTPEDTHLAVKMFILKIPTKELAPEYNIEQQSMSNKKTLFRKRLLVIR